MWLEVLIVYASEINVSKFREAIPIGCWVTKTYVKHVLEENTHVFTDSAGQGNPARTKFIAMNNVFTDALVTLQINSQSTAISRDILLDMSSGEQNIAVVSKVCGQHI